MEIKIVKFKARRGTNEQRKSAILEQGEFVYTLDTKRLYVGNGVLSGGDSPTSRIFPPVNSKEDLYVLQAEVGDMAPIDQTLYQLIAQPSDDGSNWIPLSTNPVTSISLSSLSASQLNPNSFLNGIKIENYQIQADINTKSLEISANKISIKQAGIDEREISSTSFGNGISGGSGQKIFLNVDTNYFNFDIDTGKLTINESLSSQIIDVDDETITNVGGTISQTNIGADGYSEFASLSTDEYGRVIDLGSAFYDTLTGFDAINPIFNGTPIHSLSGGIDGLNLTVLSALSTFSYIDEFDNEISDTVVITLSSAGFITFEGNTFSRSGQEIGRYAIPIFAY